MFKDEDRYRLNILNDRYYEMHKDITYIREDLYKDNLKRLDKIFRLENENTELKTKVELYEVLINRLLKIDPNLEDLSNKVLVYNGELYIVDRYSLESSNDANKVLHLDMKCTTPITKNFKEDN